MSFRVKRYHWPMYTDDHEAYRCEACGKEFDTERALRAHVRSVGLVD